MLNDVAVLIGESDGSGSCGGIGGGLRNGGESSPSVKIISDPSIKQPDSGIVCCTCTTNGFKKCRWIRPGRRLPKEAEIWDGGSCGRGPSRS